MDPYFLHHPWSLPPQSLPRTPIIIASRVISAASFLAFAIIVVTAGALVIAIAS